MPEAGARVLIERSLERIRTRLLDLTGRNPLLKYSPGRRGVRIVDELPNETYRALLDGDALTLDPRQDDDPKEHEPVSDTGVGATTDGEVTFELPDAVGEVADQDHRGRVEIVVPESVVHALKMPHALPCPRVETEQRFGE